MKEKGGLKSYFFMDSLDPDLPDLGQFDPALACAALRLDLMALAGGLAWAWPESGLSLAGLGL